MELLGGNNLKRQEILSKLGFTIPESKKKRVIISADIACEADDPFAIMHHLLTPSEDVKAIIAAHFEWTNRVAEDTINSTNQQSLSEKQLEQAKKLLNERGRTMENSYQAGRKILELSGIEDVPLLRGARYELKDKMNIPESEGADFIIEEALQDDKRPLFIACQGAITDVAIALLKKPEIADKFTVIWIGGGTYPNGGWEFNAVQDIFAANIVLQSPVNMWQIPNSTYRTMELSFAELTDKVQNCGKIGEYLCGQMFEFNNKMGKIEGASVQNWPHGETWCIGDNPTISVLLQGVERNCWHEVPAPLINPDCTYSAADSANRKIRVYDSIDIRLTLSDFFSKMKKCYGNALT